MVFRKKSVATITKTLTKIVNDLDTVVAEEEVRRADKEAAAKRLLDEAKLHEDECCRARKIAKNVGSLLTV